MSNDGKRWFIGIKRRSHTGSNSDIDAIVALYCKNILQAQDLLKEVRGVGRDKFPKELRPAVNREPRIIEEIIREEAPDHYHFFKYIKQCYRIDIMKWNEKRHRYIQN
ncbi:MAG: hypothetical protein NT139_03140 [Candidatus Woesearchaeota archaeon]|nr:hypothetical protein [Candidatus Woesearchaeota archaeon]